MGELSGFTEVAKFWIMAVIGGGRDGSHVMLGMVLFIGAIWLARGRYVGTAWFALLALELVNEWIDSASPATTATASIKDICTTMIGPSLVWLVLIIDRRSHTEALGEDSEQALE